jgi:hypothetical protein
MAQSQEKFKPAARMAKEAASKARSLGSEVQAAVDKMTGGKK